MKADLQALALDCIAANQATDAELDAETVKADQEPKSRIVLLSATDIVQDDLEAKYLVRRYIEKSTRNLWFGDYGTKKTFTVLDLMFRISMGMDWCGMESEQGGCVYFMGEGAGAVKRRVAAWCQYHKVDYREFSKNFLFLGSNLFVSPNDTDTETEVIDVIHQRAEQQGMEKIAAIGWDTASTMFGVEEDKAGDVEAMYQCLKRISTQCDDAADFVVHHVGHNEKFRPRGSYAWSANADATQCFVRDGDRILLKAGGKMKDAEEVPYDRAFTFSKEILGVDKYGDDITSLVPVYQGKADSIDEPKKLKLNDQEKELLGLVTGFIADAYNDGDPKPKAWDLSKKCFNHEETYKTVEGTHRVLKRLGNTTGTPIVFDMRDKSLTLETIPLLFKTINNEKN